MPLNLIRIAGLDPGKQVDSFGLVSLVINPRENEIFVEFAKRWLRVDYLKVEEEIHSLHKQAQWTNIYCEQNNTGEHVIEVLKRKYGLPVKPVTTSNKITDPKKLHNVKSMSKNEMTWWYLKAKQKHIVKFPEKSTNVDMLELIRQIAIFAEHKTEAGNVTYYAPGEEHDDLVMALLIACFAARKYVRVANSGGGPTLVATLDPATTTQNRGRGGIGSIEDAMEDAELFF